MTRISAQPSLTEPVVHQSLGLSALLQHLRWDRTYTILDLGPALGVNVDFLSQFQCKIYVADLYRSIASSGAFASESSTPLEDTFQELLPYPPDTRFDVILSWDLFNYLGREQLDGLVRHLIRFCSPGTFVFSLLFILQHMPTQPTSFKILDRERLIYDNRSPVASPCPRYQPRDMMKIMSGFHVLSSFLLRHGIQEYVFEYDGSGGVTTNH